MNASLTIERLKEMLDYDPATGVFVWRQRPAKNSRRRAGDVAGSIQKNGYRYISFDGEEYPAARLAWFYANGKWPDSLLRFQNGDAADLRIGNLNEGGYVATRFDHSTREGRVAYMKAHRSENPEYYRALELKRSFGIDLAEYQRLFVEQGGVCACCSKPETATRSGKTKWLAVDHDHATGAVRGLLCVACNTGLGKFGDSVETLTSAIAYLKHHAPATSAASDNVVPLTKKESI